MTQMSVGDYAVFTVRRGCGACPPCRMGRADMCQTGKYHERGIKGLDGFQTEYVVDKEQYFVRVPAGLESVGVLMEPFPLSRRRLTRCCVCRSCVVRRPHPHRIGYLSAGAW